MMISSEELKQLSKSEIENCDKEQLVDITTVKLNPSDSVEKRLDSYIQQIKNHARAATWRYWPAWAPWAWAR